MSYKDYRAEVILREQVPGYGHSVELYATAENETAAAEAAKNAFKAFTGMPLYIIESVEVAPVLAERDAATHRETAGGGKA